MEGRHHRPEARREQGTATNVIAKLDDDHFTFQFIDRTLDGKPVPDAKPVKMKRVK